jgi:hypothetical protein
MIVAVPRLVELGRGQSQVAGKVDDRGGGIDLAKAGGVGGGDPVGHGEEVRIGLALEPGFVGKMAGAGRERDGGLGMGGQEAYELPSRVTRGPGPTRIPNVRPPCRPKKKPAGALAPGGSAGPFDCSPN